MSGKWQNSDRRSRLPADWPKIVAKVKQRDEHRCRAVLPSGKRCPRRGTDVDHIIAGDDHSLGNLQLLCPDHHTAKSSAEGLQAKRRKKQVRLRDDGPHPGRIG